MLAVRPVVLAAVAGFASSCASHTPPPPQAPATIASNATIACDSCAEWNAAHAPFKLFGNTYYVGPAGLSSVLITTSAGLIVLDGALPQSAAVIAANLRTLGFRPEDVRLIANSHAHYDHAGGIAALQRMSGARVISSPSGARALEHGEPTEDDPQYHSGHAADRRFPAVPHVDVVPDNQPIALGDVTITPHFTPGHTPGSTTWTWKSCDAGRCIDIVYADSLNAISDDGFRFTGDASHPSLVAAFQHSIDVVDHLPCDLIVSVHPGLTNLDDKLAARARGTTPDPFLDPNACHAYAADATAKLAKRVADEH